MIKSVKDIRESGFIGIEKKHGIYKWWFREESVTTLLSSLGSYVDFSKLKSIKDQHMIINNQHYTLLYVGIAAGGNGIRDRFKWHIAQKHSPSTISKGYLSTLRRTLMGLLMDRSTDTFYTFGEKRLNDFMDDNCYLEWEYKDMDKHSLECEESKIINAGYYPLNIQGNNQISDQLKEELKKSRKI